MLAFPAQAANSGIRKVLPHLIDKKGRTSIAPGLFEREAYQRQLRSNPKNVSGVRFNIQWNANGTPEERLKLRIYVRTSKRIPSKPLEIETALQTSRGLGGWSSFELSGKSYQEAGEVLAWKVVLLDGSKEIGQQQSFLW